MGRAPCSLPAEFLEGLKDFWSWRGGDPNFKGELLEPSSWTLRFQSEWLETECKRQ